MYCRRRLYYRCPHPLQSRGGHATLPSAESLAHGLDAPAGRRHQGSTGMGERYTSGMDGRGGGQVGGRYTSGAEGGGSTTPRQYWDGEVARSRCGGNGGTAHIRCGRGRGGEGVFWGGPIFYIPVGGADVELQTKQSPLDPTVCYISDALALYPLFSLSRAAVPMQSFRPSYGPFLRR